MIVEYSAQRTKEIVSFCRINGKDVNPKKIEADEIIHLVINEVCSEIAKKTLCIKDYIEFSLIPDKYEYRYMEIVEAANYIKRVERFTIIDCNKCESKPFDFKIDKLFHDRRLEDSCGNIFTFDESTFSFWKPVSDNNSIGKIKVARFVLPGEKVGFDKNPPIPPKYDEYIPYGVFYRLCGQFPDLHENPQYFLNEYEKYKQERFDVTTSDHGEADHVDF
jgi:hypothetical protein